MFFVAALVLRGVRSIVRGMAGAGGAESASEVRRVYLVCTSNVCRSPAAEALARLWLARRCGVDTSGEDGPATTRRIAKALAESDCEGKGGFVVGSRSLTDRYEPPGSAASANSVKAMHELYGVDISEHRSALLTREEVAGATAILCVTGRHRDEVLRIGNRAKGLDKKVVALAEDVEDCWRCAYPVCTGLRSTDFGTIPQFALTTVVHVASCCVQMLTASSSWLEWCLKHCSR